MHKSQPIRADEAAYTGAQHFRDITLDSRFGNAEGGHFSDVNLTSVLFKGQSRDGRAVRRPIPLVG